MRARSDALRMLVGGHSRPHAQPKLCQGSPQTQSHTDGPLCSNLSPLWAGRDPSRNASVTEQSSQASLASVRSPSPVTPGSRPLHLAPGVPHPDQVHHLALVVHLFPRAPVSACFWHILLTPLPATSSSQSPAQHPAPTVRSAAEKPVWA